MTISFAEHLRANCDRRLKEIDSKLQRIAFNLFMDIVVATPIEKGELINNWFPHNGVDFSSEITTLLDKSGGGSKARIYSNMGQGTFLGKDGVMTLANNLDYAYKIEYEGWSRHKAPEGMVRISVAKTLGKIQAGAL